MGSTRICIYYANTGGGHKSAANAIAAGLRAMINKGLFGRAKVSIRRRSIAEKTHPANCHLINLYNHLARYHTTWIKYFYYLIHLIQPDSPLFYRFYRPFVHDMLKEDRPSIIVVVHPMLPQCLTYALEELKIESKVKLAVVITDPNDQLWRGWGAKQADLIVAPNEAVREKLLSWDIPGDKIKVLGMPVHPKFLSPPTLTRSRFLKKLGLSPDLFTVCINSSWAGNEHWLETYRALTNCKRKIQVVFLCGHNEALQQEVRIAASETGIPTAILEFHNKMPDLMNAVDLMVTKAGGLTTYEAVARRLPLVLDNTIEPMPQEAPTMKMIIESGLAKALNKPEDIASIVDSMAVQSTRQTRLPDLHQLDLTDKAIFEIARSVLLLTNAEVVAQPALKEVA